MGVIALVVPAIAFIAALIIPGILILDYVHVLFGALWTGVDVFMGLIFFIVLSGMEDKIRSDISFRLIPMLLYFIPAMSVFTPLLGFTLAMRENMFRLDYLFIAIITISIILAVVSFAVYMPAVIVDADIAGIKYSIVGVNLMEILVFSKLSNPLIT